MKLQDLGLNIQFSFKSKASPLIAGQFDCFVLEESSKNALIERVSAYPSAKAELVALFKENKKAIEVSDGFRPATLQLGYEGRGGLAAVFVNKNHSTYALHEAMRKCFTAAMQVEREGEVVFHVPGLKNDLLHSVLSSFVSLMVLSGWRPEVYGKKQASRQSLPKRICTLVSSLPPSEMEALALEAALLALANNQVRTLADLPGNVLTPRSYRERVKKIAGELESPVSFEFLDRKALKQKKAGAFLAVVQADPETESGIAHLCYKGNAKAGVKKLKKVALVGKGLCFDTGGYNIKTGEYMHNMHRDMTGSAVAFSLFCLLVQLKVPYEVHLYLALAENLVSISAYRPNDVVMAMNGMSIEVVDTDAEGRMVLSDTLVLASLEKPDLMLDFATLTGSVVRAIDTRRCGVYSNRPSLGRMAVEVGEKAGERVWNFPIGEDYEDGLKSELADIRQISSSKSADHIYAATFLSQFVAKEIPWIHMDLAADTHAGGLGLVATDTTGFGVRWALQLIREFFS